MERKIEQLVEVLEETKRHYEQMLALVHDEQAAATASDFERFSRIGVEKESLVARIRKTEQHRNAILQTLAATFDIPTQQLNITTLIELSGVAVYDVFESLTFYFIFDLLRDTNMIGTRHIHQVSRRNGNLGCEAGPFGTHWILNHLHDNILTLAQQ